MKTHQISKLSLFRIIKYFRIEFLRDCKTFYKVSLYLNYYKKFILNFYKLTNFIYTYITT